MAEINQVEIIKAREKWVTPKTGSLTKTNKLDKPLARLVKKKSKKKSSNKIWNWSGNTAINISEIKRIVSTIQHCIPAPCSWVLFCHKQEWALIGPRMWMNLVDYDSTDKKQNP
jgi:hypothetical protein